MLELVLVVAVKLYSFSCLGGGTVLRKPAYRVNLISASCGFDPIWKFGRGLTLHIWQRKHRSVFKQCWLARISKIKHCSAYISLWNVHCTEMWNPEKKILEHIVNHVMSLKLTLILISSRIFLKSYPSADLHPCLQRTWLLVEID